MTTTPQTFCLPRVEDILSVLHGHIRNPHHSKCREESRKWISEYHNIVCGPNMRVFLEACNIELSSSYCYPYASKEGLQAGMDVANVIYTLDEFTDTISGEDAEKVAVVVEQSLGENDFDDGSWVCQMMKDYKRNHIVKFGHNVSRRFINHFCEYVKYTATEAELRQKDQVLDIHSYIPFRRNAGEIKVVFDIAEYCLGLDLPDYVYEDPIFMIGYLAALDIAAFKNDLYSYNMEQAKGHANANIITVIMKDKGINLQSAVDFLSGYLERLAKDLFDAKSVLCSPTSPIDIYSGDAVILLEALWNWVRGYDIWSFTTERYFGGKTRDVKEMRVVELRKPFEDFAALKE